MKVGASEAIKKRYVKELRELTGGYNSFIRTGNNREKISKIDQLDRLLVSTAWETGYERGKHYEPKDI